MIRGAVALVVAGLVLGGSARSAAAADRVLFARAGWLLSVNSKGRGLKRIARLKRKRRIAAINASSNGVVVVRDNAGAWHWVNSKARRRKRKLVRLACAGRAHLAGNGTRIVCTGDPKASQIYDLASGGVQSIPVALHQVDFKSAHGLELVVASRGKLWAFPLANYRARRRLAPHAPKSGLRVAPDGSRAVGRYRDGKHDRIFTFRLDGDAKRRRLLRNATPVAWSADSRWVLAQARSLACIVRGVGGQFKCWRGYRALAIAPDGSVAILGRPDKRKPKRIDLYTARLDGAKTARPKLLVRNAEMAAAWHR